MANFSSEDAYACTGTDEYIVAIDSPTTIADQKVLGRTVNQRPEFGQNNSNIVQLSVRPRKDKSKQLTYHLAGIGTYTVPEIVTLTLKILRTSSSEVLAWNAISSSPIPLSKYESSPTKGNVTAWVSAQIPAPVSTKRRRTARHLRRSPYAVQWRFNATPVISENSRKGSTRTGNSRLPSRRRTSGHTGKGLQNQNTENSANTNPISHYPPSDINSQVLPIPTESHQARRRARAVASSSNANIKLSKSPISERERIKGFWFGLSAEERRSFVQIEKDTLLRKLKERQKCFCSCAVCSRKHDAMEKELEVLYDAYYEDLEQYVNYQQRYISSDETIPPLSPFPGSVEVDKAYPTLPHQQANSNFSLCGPGNILTVADDLLKNDDRNFLKMMEQLAERRMADEESKAKDSQSEEADDRKAEEDDEEDEQTDEEDEDTDEDEEDEDKDEDEEDEISMEEQKMEDKQIFSIFAARLFEPRVLKAYHEQLAQERQLQLLKELEEEDKSKAEKKKRQREKKKERRKAKKQQKQAKEPSRALVSLEGESQQFPHKHDATPNEDDDGDDTETLVDDSGDRENSPETIDDLLKQPANGPFIHEDVTKPESPNSSQLPSHSVSQPGSPLAPTGNSNSIGVRIKNIIAAFTVLRSLENAKLDSDFVEIRDKLVKQWWLTAALILGIFAVDIAAYALSPDSLFQISQGGRFATSASGLIIATAASFDTYLIARFSWLEGGSFKAAATDAYDSFVCFSILFSLPLFLVFLSSSLLAFLLIAVAYDSLPILTVVWLGIIGSIYILPSILWILRKVTRLLRRMHHALFDVFGIISDFVVAFTSYFLDRLTGVLHKLGLR